MDDMDKLLTGIVRAIESLNASVNEINSYLKLQKQQLEAQLAAQLAAQAAAQSLPRKDFMSGRWPRRDGDGFVSVSNGDHPTGVVRPPNVSGD